MSSPHAPAEDADVDELLEGDAELLDHLRSFKRSKTRVQSNQLRLTPRASLSDQRNTTQEEQPQRKTRISSSTHIPLLMHISSNRTQGNLFYPLPPPRALAVSISITGFSADAGAMRFFASFGVKKVRVSMSSLAAA